MLWKLDNGPCDIIFHQGMDDDLHYITLICRLNDYSFNTHILTKLDVIIVTSNLWFQMVSNLWSITKKSSTPKFNKYNFHFYQKILMYRNGEGRWENWFICLDGYLLPIKKKKKRKPFQNLKMKHKAWIMS